MVRSLIRLRKRIFALEYHFEDTTTGSTDEFRHIMIPDTAPLIDQGLYKRISQMTQSDLTISHGNSSSTLPSAIIGGYFFVDLMVAREPNELKEIADRMRRSGYENEFVQTYCSVRRDALDKYLQKLGIDKPSIEEAQKNIEWDSLEGKMRKWVQAVKIVMDIVSREKSLYDNIFHDADGIKEICFNEIVKGFVMQLLSFGEAVAIGRRPPEKLFGILGMYDAMAHELPYFEAMVTDEFVINKAKGVLCGLGEAASGTFVEFKNAVHGERWETPMQSGDIHPKTPYVIGYLKLLVENGDTLKLLLESGEDDGFFVALQNDSDSDNDIYNDNSELSPVARRLLLLVMSSVQATLKAKSKLCEDSALKYIFLMNNFQYVVQEVKDSVLGKVLGDNDWVRKRSGQIDQYAMSYLCASWSKALSCLKDEGIGGSTSDTKKVVAALKERFKYFNTCFEEIYGVQTAWKVPDAQLREKLRISISEKLILGYSSFLGRYGNQVERKYIKYTAEDLQSYLWDLFEGSPRVLNHMKKKSKRNVRASSGVLLVFSWHGIDVIKKLHLCPFGWHRCNF
ncbi:exocyst complex component EXO70B1-like [Alnus glutinosa]|uniref:exocyst complex component EXO70B1-like n=1 Tax=Alnus glutinosa TaxID=3517 RepID=UPI002D798D97|nr:exocyst complex component EXO70B1-like [Alnus glutinosa]